MPKGAVKPIDVNNFAFDPGGFYGTENLQPVAKLMREWRDKYPETNRTERSIGWEFRLYIQYLIMNQVQDPLNPGREWIDRWLELAKGLDIHAIRLKIFERLDQEYGIKYPEHLPPAPENIAYPDHFHFFNWRKYHKEVYRRSRKIFGEITTEKVIRLERQTWPYYQAIHMAEIGIQSDQAVNQVHLDSHKYVADFLKKIIPYRKDGKYKILEFGCGDGGLFLELRKIFPNAALVGTNLFGTESLLDQVQSDKNVTIRTDVVEEFDYELGAYDAVLSTEVIEHLVNPSDMIKQAHKALKKNGAFLISAPSVHVIYLNNNPMTYLFSFISTVFNRILPKFHNLWQPLTDLHIIHYAFSYREYKSMFREYFPAAKVESLRFTHLKKFRLSKVAQKIPLLRRWGGLLMAYGHKTD